MQQLFGQHVLRNTDIFVRSKLSVAFVNLKPIVPGHVLVIPKRVVKRFTDLTEEEVSDLFLTTQRVGRVIERFYGGTSLTISMQDGPEAGQSVHHVHVHALPRRVGDFPRNDDIYDELQSWKVDNESRLARSEEEMAKEASLLAVEFQPY